MKFWSSGQLRVAVLGPMRSGDQDPATQANCEIIKEVAQSVLAETATRALMAKAGFESAKVECPEDWQGNDIRSAVFRAIERADLVVFDVSPRTGESGPSPNVMYEMGLVHALRLPYVMIQKYGCSTPFYLDSLRRIELPAAAYPDAARLSSALRTQFQAILDPSSDANFETNPISQHFANAALGDVSPTAGLALGHHFHFLRPMLGEPNYLRFHAPRQIERVVTLVPNSVRSGAQRDFDDLQRLIESAGLRVEDCVLQLRDNGPDAGNHGLHVKRVGTVCFDVPTAAYALRIARREGQVAEDIAAMEQRSLQQFARETAQLLQRASARHDIDVGRHLLARIPTTVEEVIRIFGP